ncbi:hypothetical protein APSETT445_007299 [Aspergillus pseudonomiae]
MGRHDQNIPQWMKATEGLSGAATLYGLLGILFSCCLGGVAFFAAVAVVLDICFVGAMIAIAIMTRNGTQQCSGRVDTPLGSGESNAESPSKVKYEFACQLQKVTFAVAIIGIFFFLVSILFQVLYARHHKREKRFGPSPANDYTYGTRPRAFWRRKKNNPDTASADDMLPTHPTPQDVELGPTQEKPSGFDLKSERELIRSLYLGKGFCVGEGFMEYYDGSLGVGLYEAKLIGGWEAFAGTKLYEEV